MNKVDAIKKDLLLKGIDEYKDFYSFDSSKELHDCKLIGYEHLGAIKGIVKA